LRIVDPGRLFATLAMLFVTSTLAHAGSLPL